MSDPIKNEFLQDAWEELRDMLEAGNFVDAADKIFEVADAGYETEAKKMNEEFKKAKGY